MPRKLCFHRRLLVSLFVCWQDYTKTTQPIFVKFGGKVAHGPRKKPLDFGGNSIHVTLGLALGHSLADKTLLFNFGQNPRLEVVFYWSITGTFVRGYDPSPKNFSVSRFCISCLRPFMLNISLFLLNK